MPLTPKNRKEEWLQGLVDHETTLTPKNRKEEWMLGLVEGSTTLEPKNRKEEWMKEIIDASGGGGGSTWQLVGSGEFEVNTTSTSAIEIGTVATDPSVYTDEKIVYIQIRDKAGKRDGYYYGSDCFIEKKTQTSPAGFTFRVQSGSTQYYVGAYGLYPTQINSFGVVKISAKYNSTYSSTIDGTYAVNIYLLDYPANPPFTD